MTHHRLWAPLWILAWTCLSSAAPVDGRWEGRMKSPEGEDLPLAFTFKVEGEKLSGSVETPDGNLPISEGKLKGDEFSFLVDSGGNTVEHQCKVAGDTVSMRILFSQDRTAEVTLTRATSAGTVTPTAAAATAPADPSGSWTWTVTTPNGDTFEASLKLALKNGVLSGTYNSRMGEAPIYDASFQDGAVAFSVVREFDGNKFLIKYQGMLAGDTIKGMIEVPGVGGREPSKINWNATRVK